MSVNATYSAAVLGPCLPRRRDGSERHGALSQPSRMRRRRAALHSGARRPAASTGTTSRRASRSRTPSRRASSAGCATSASGLMAQAHQTSHSRDLLLFPDGGIDPSNVGTRRCPTSDSSGTRFRVILFALERTMAQHFLLSAAARTLSLKAIYAEGEDAAYDQFCKLRWPATAGAPICPRCAWQEAYSLSTRRRFKCKACHHQFSVTSGTIFASRKLAFVDLLGAIALFSMQPRGCRRCSSHAAWTSPTRRPSCSPISCARR